MANIQFKEGIPSVFYVIRDCDSLLLFNGRCGGGFIFLLYDLPYFPLPAPCDALPPKLSIEDRGFGHNRQQEGQYSAQGGYSVSALC